MSRRRKKVSAPAYVPRKGFLKDRYAERILPKSEALLKIEALQAEIAEAAAGASRNVTPITSRRRGGKS